MKKLIGVIAILFALIACIIYRHLAGRQTRTRPETVSTRVPLRDQLVIFTLLMQ
ncbi:MAG TPA: hypothetical protein VN616_09220 [Puia sp.]|nr:hypothetical protein [Puia sp.]